MLCVVQYSCVCFYVIVLITLWCKYMFTTIMGTHLPLKFRFKAVVGLGLGLSVY